MSANTVGSTMNNHTSTSSATYSIDLQRLLTQSCSEINLASNDFTHLGVLSEPKTMLSGSYCFDKDTSWLTSRVAHSWCCTTGASHIS